MEPSVFLGPVDFALHSQRSSKRGNLLPGRGGFLLRLLRLLLRPLWCRWRFSLLCWSSGLSLAHVLHRFRCRWFHHLCCFLPLLLCLLLLFRSSVTLRRPPRCLWFGRHRLLLGRFRGVTTTSSVLRFDLHRRGRRPRSFLLLSRRGLFSFLLSRRLLARGLLPPSASSPPYRRARRRARRAPGLQASPTTRPPPPELPWTRHIARRCNRSLLSHPTQPPLRLP